MPTPTHPCRWLNFLRAWPHEIAHAHHGHVILIHRWHCSEHSFLSALPLVGADSDLGTNVSQFYCFVIVNACTVIGLAIAILFHWMRRSSNISLQLILHKNYCTKFKDFLKRDNSFILNIASFYHSHSNSCSLFWLLILSLLSSCCVTMQSMHVLF